MRYLCNNCDETMAVKYYWEGLSVICPTGGKLTELWFLPEKNHARDIGYSISFTDFEELPTCQSYFATIAPLVQELLNCSIEKTEKGVRLIEGDGALIPLEAAHFEIQFNPTSQRMIYETAMDLWR